METNYDKTKRKSKLVMRLKAQAHQLDENTCELAIDAIELPSEVRNMIANYLPDLEEHFYVLLDKQALLSSLDRR